MNGQLTNLADRIENLKIELETGTILEITNILAGIVTELKLIDARLAAAERRAFRADNTASCLANGIQPD